MAKRITLTEASERSGLSEETIRYATERKWVQGEIVNRQHWIYVESLERYVKHRQAQRNAPRKTAAARRRERQEKTRAYHLQQGEDTTSSE